MDLSLFLFFFFHGEVPSGHCDGRADDFVPECCAANLCALLSSVLTQQQRAASL